MKQNFYNFDIQSTFFNKIQRIKESESSNDTDLQKSIIKYNLIINICYQRQNIIYNHARDLNIIYSYKILFSGNTI